MRSRRERARYYVSTSLITGAKGSRSGGRRIPAGNLEGLVINRLCSFFVDAASILDAVDIESRCGSEQSRLIERGRQIGEDLGGDAPDKIKALLMALLCRVEIRSDRIDITVSRSRLINLLSGSLDLKMEHRGSPKPPGDPLTLMVPARLKRAGREMRLLVENAGDQKSADSSLLRIIARAHHVQARMMQNPTLTVHDIAQDEQVSAAYPLYPPASSLAGTRHHHGHHQWPKTTATYRPDIDALDATAASKLGRTARAPRLPLKTNRRRRTL